MKMRLHRMLAAACIAGAVAAQGQTPGLGPALHVGVTNALVDEFSQPLKGVTPAATSFGFTPVPGEIVQVLLITNGVHAPAADGTPDSQDALIFEGRVGDGMDPGAGPTSMFGVSVPRRPSGGQVVARVFNKASLSASSFYADSQVFPISPSFNDAFIATFSSTTQPMDGTDPDGDGLNNSWEKSLGADPDLPDTDGDGMADGQEWRAGTMLTDSHSVLAMVQLNPVDDAVVNVTWDTVTGRVYQVEFRPGELGDTTNSYQAVSGIVTALTASTTLTVTNDIAPVGHYRIHLVEP